MYNGIQQGRARIATHKHSYKHTYLARLRLGCSSATTSEER